MTEPTFAQQVRQVRGGESQREFAARVGTTQQTVGKWERGEAAPRSIGVRHELARLGVKCPGLART